MSDLRVRQATAALALEFAVLTAARSGEVLGARWDEFDLDRAVWTIPAARMKAGREHRVPLSRRALKIVKTMRRGRRPQAAERRDKLAKRIDDKDVIRLLRLKVEQAEGQTAGAKKARISRTMNGRARPPRPPRVRCGDLNDGR